MLWEGFTEMKSQELAQILIGIAVILLGLVMLKRLF